MLCKHCGKNPAIENSHIFSKSLYKNLKNDRGQLVAVTLDPNDDVFPEQDGLKESLLCSVCEHELSIAEDYGEKFINGFVSGKLKKVQVLEIDAGMVEVRNFNYPKLKRFVLCQFYRASLATDKHVAEYKLRGNEKLLGDVIFSDNDIPPERFPVSINRVEYGAPGVETLSMMKPLDVHGLEWRGFIARGLLFQFMNSLDRLFQDSMRPDGMLVGTVPYQWFDARGQMAQRYWDPRVARLYGTR